MDWPGSKAMGRGVKAGYTMDNGILLKQIYIIFDREKILLAHNTIPWSVDTSHGDKEIIYDHSNTLMNIYTELQDGELKEMFVDNLLYTFTNEQETIGMETINQWDYDLSFYSSTGALIFFTLLQLGFKDIITKSIKTRTDDRKDKGWTDITLVHFLHDLLSTGKKYFDIELISSLLYFLQSQTKKISPSYINLVANVQLDLANLGYEEIKESILNENIEISRDKEKLTAFLSNNGFDKKYEHLLKEIDEYINTNSTIVTSGMIGNMRSFMEDLITDLARKISANNNEQIPENENMGHMGNIRSYLKNKLELSEKDNQLINKYIEILHSEGGHSFTANVEYFRLAKNIGIEIGLFLLSKTHNLILLKNKLEFKDDI